MNLISAVVCIIGIISFCSIVNRGDYNSIIVCALYSIMILAQAVEMVEYWFQSKLLSKYIAMVSLFAYTLVSVYKVILLITKKSVYWFSVSNALDYAIIGVILLIIIQKKYQITFSFSYKVLRRLLKKSKYYIISGLMVTVFAQTDRVMLKLMVNDSAVGFYSAAVTIAGMSGFIFTAIIDSMRPVIFEGRKENNEIFEERLKQLHTIVIYFALIQSAFITAFSSVIVKVIYGNQYIGTIGALKIIVWYTTFSYYGGAKDIWILAEGKQKYLIWLNLAGAVTNIILNFVLIPFYGINGAAFASLCTQFITNIVMGFIIPQLRYNNFILLESLKLSNVVLIYHTLYEHILKKFKLKRGQ